MLAEQWPGEQNDETDAAYQKDEGVEVKQTVGKLRQALPDSVGLGPGAQQDMGLASDDADADGGGKQGGDSAVMESPSNICSPPEVTTAART
jgi:hypothetical protein